MVILNGLYFILLIFHGVRKLNNSLFFIIQELIKNIIAIFRMARFNCYTYYILFTAMIEIC